MENALNYHSLVNQLQFSFKKKNKVVSGYTYKAVSYNCSEQFIKAVAKYPEVSIKQLATATKTINDFNFVCDIMYPSENYLNSREGENNHLLYVDLINNTKNKSHLIGERLFTSFKGL